MSALFPTCPVCKSDLSAAEIRHHGWTTSIPGTCNADLIIECDACGAAFNAFISATAFEQVVDFGRPARAIKLEQRHD